MTAGEIENAQPVNPSEEVEQRNTRRLAADLRADHTEVEVADEIVTGRRVRHARHHRIRAPCSSTGVVGWTKSDRFRSGGGHAELYRRRERRRTGNSQQLLSHRAAGWRVEIDEPFATEQHTEQWGRQASQQAKWPCSSSSSVDLGPVASKRFALEASEPSDIDPVSDRRLRAVRSAERLGVVSPQDADQSESIEDPHKLFAWHCRLQDAAGPGQLCGADSDVVNADVIGVSVSALRVVREQDIGALLTQNLGEPRRGLLDRCPHESRTVGRVRKEHRPVSAIGVAQVLYARHAEHARAGPKFVKPQGRALADRFSHHPVAGHHDDRTVPFRCQARQGSTGEKHLVIRMCMEGDDRSHYRFNDNYLPPAPIRGLFR